MVVPMKRNSYCIPKINMKRKEKEEEKKEAPQWNKVLFQDPPKTPVKRGFLVLTISQ